MEIVFERDDIVNDESKMTFQQLSFFLMATTAGESDYPDFTIFVCEEEDRKSARRK